MRQSFRLSVHMYNLTYTVYINFSGAQYDKIAVDVEKSSIYKTDINVHVHEN